MLDNYNPPSIKFSARRRPAEGYHFSSILLQTTLSQASDKDALAAAIAVCLGQWASVQDVLLGKLVTDGYIPIRVKWSPTDTWHQVIQSVQSWKEPISKERVATTLGLDHKHEPFAATLHFLDDKPAEELTDSSPILFRLSQDGQTLTLKALLNCFSPAVSELCLQLLNNILVALRTRGSDSVEKGYLHPESPLLSADSRESHLLPPYRHVMSWVDERAHYQPEIPAVIYYETIQSSCQEQQLTYRELSLRSSQLAQHLVCLGVNLGDKIAVCMKRNLDFHITLLAILKSGACYVPVRVPLLKRSLLIT
jgi:ferricrocin synthase